MVAGVVFVAAHTRARAFNTHPLSCKIKKVRVLTTLTPLVLGLGVLNDILRLEGQNESVKEIWKAHVRSYFPGAVLAHTPLFCHPWIYHTTVIPTTDTIIKN